MRYTTMETTNIVDFARRYEMTDTLTDLLITRAQELIATAVEAEFATYLAQFAELRTKAGHAAVTILSAQCRPVLNHCGLLGAARCVASM